MYGMNSVIHVNMHEALCRHVKGKNKSQGGGGRGGVLK